MSGGDGVEVKPSTKNQTRQLATASHGDKDSKGLSLKHFEIVQWSRRSDGHHVLKHSARMQRPIPQNLADAQLLVACRMLARELSDQGRGPFQHDGHVILPKT